MAKPEDTNNLFVRIWRRIRDDDTSPDNGITREHDQRTLAHHVLSDVYTDVVAKVLDKFREIDLESMDGITLQVKVPGEKYPKYVKVKPITLKPFFDAIMEEAGQIQAKPYQAYQPQEQNFDGEQQW